VCGRADILEGASGRRLGRPDYVSLTGTYSGNPISCSAAVAALDVLREPGTYERVFALGRRFMTSLQSLFDRAGIPVHVTGEPPAFQPWFTSEEIVDHRSILRADAAKGMRFTELLLDRGILKAHEKFFVSVVHTDEDIDHALGACASAIDEMRS
jgi:glutamate-1-semialdehyde 2,1-aminomutase